ncbi:MAG: Fe-S cluster assembly protein HesB [Actinomycetota bacterium]|jgi:uncharacterized HhH-GPD family protein|nr:Fe-S cluster assembly protein HesB [Actinomycetota bacterium]
MARTDRPTSLPLTGDADADRLLADDPLALLIGMVLDQQIPLERAFRAPMDLRDRLGGRLEAADIAARPPDELAAAFSAAPALHRYPSSMAGRVQQVCQVLVDRYGGDAAALWEGAADGGDLLARVAALPGFGDQKARIFVALLGKRLGVRPPGWEEASAPFGSPGTYHSVADVDSPEALARVREHKAALKAAAKAGGRG